jgi:hypothetical protein
MIEEIELEHPGGSLEVENTRRRLSVEYVLFACLQIVGCGLCFAFYERLYYASEYGAAACIASVMSGLSQGLLQVFVHRELRLSSIAKFYTWGIINGLWTVCNVLLRLC